MKKLILLAGLFLFFTACKNEKNTADAAANKVGEIVAEEEFDEFPNETDLDFDVAISAFRKNDYETAARYINLAVDDLKNETTVTDSESKKELESTITAMQLLADRVESGKVTDEAELQELFAHADMLTAHHYTVLYLQYGEDAPTQRKNALKKAEERVGRATQKLEGEAKKDAKSIREKIRAALVAGDKKADKIGDAAGEKVIEIRKRLKAHLEKHGNKPPKESDG